LARRLGTSAIIIVRSWAGLNDPTSERLDDHFPAIAAGIGQYSPLPGRESQGVHQGAGGDSRKDAFDLYTHINLKEPKEAYLACIP
jgi:hypothetical protein